SRSTRALAFAGSFVVCLLAGGILAITLMGQGHGPSYTLELSEVAGAAAPHGKAQSAAASTRDSGPEPAPAAAIGPITQTLHAGRALLADPALVQNTPQGPLPRIADDGRKPMTAYAAPASGAKKFKIAIMVGGLGVSASATQSALASLPPAVTLGFAPYAGDVGDWVRDARSRGHEVVLQIPMEPFDFPDSDPGPHTLRAGMTEEANIDRLHWSLSRFTGYAGVTNLLGQRFLSDSAALSPVLTELARRGLYFLDNGTASQSVAPATATQVGLPAVQSGGSLDSIQSALEIDRRLLELETQARANGSAVGSAFLYPVSVARIAAWAKGLESRGFVLVPVSAIVSAPKQ
ncbi:MAG TPA: divergent polysaccharide deacetylase family protein, partial [Rhizomicrobium sp.]|nr:divergent polysaccharide deacetylase family protein [Rhizomicrobium sp.]